MSASWSQAWETAVQAAQPSQPHLTAWHLPSHPPKRCHCAVPGSLDCQSLSCCSIWREEVCAGTACLLQGCGKLWLLKTPLSLKQHQLACLAAALLCSRKFRELFAASPELVQPLEPSYIFIFPQGKTQADRQTDNLSGTEHKICFVIVTKQIYQKTGGEGRKVSFQDKPGWSSPSSL